METDGAFQDPVIYWPGAVTTTFVTLEDLNGDDNLDLASASQVLQDNRGHWRALRTVAII